jgi:hypothetical protein
MSKSLFSNSFSFKRYNHKYLLFILLLILNLVIRLPSIPHEKGYDSFFIHSLANSLSTYGNAEWWLNWMSVFGFYPYSYASAVPFILSGFSQLSGIGMENTILIFCILIGFLGIFTSYILAGQLFEGYLSKYIAGLFFSIAAGVMLFTTWEASARGLFMVMFPFYLFLLFKKYTTIKSIFLITICLIFQFSVHHYAFFLIVLSIAFLCLQFARRFLPFIFKEPYMTYLFGVFLIGVFLMPFFTRFLISSGSRYGWIITSFITNARQTGPIIFFAISGVIYLLFKNKSKNDVLLLSFIVALLPTLYSHIYGPFIFLLPIVLLATIGFGNLLKASMATKKKLFYMFCIFSIVSFISFSSYYNHYRTGASDEFWYLTEDVYLAGLWGEKYIPDNSRALDVGFETGRMFAISNGHPIMPSSGAVSLAYGWINESNIQVTKNPPTSLTYYFDGPYSTKQGTTFLGSIEWLRMTASKMEHLNGYDYFVEDKYYYKPVKQLVYSESSESNLIYDSQTIAIWDIS